jgi:hypothetical protein
MNAPPPTLDGALVRYYVVLGEKHRRTGRYRHFVDGVAIIAVPALAICQYRDEATAYVFLCNEQWEVVSDDAFASIDEAME